MKCSLPFFQIVELIWRRRFDNWKQFRVIHHERGHPSAEREQSSQMLLFSAKFYETFKNPWHNSLFLKHWSHKKMNLLLLMTIKALLRKLKLAKRIFSFWFTVNVVLIFPKDFFTLFLGKWRWIHNNARWWS